MNVHTIFFMQEYDFKLGQKLLCMVLTADNYDNLQKQLNIVNKYFIYFSLDINIDGRDKPVYTNNNGNKEDKELYII